MNILTFDIEEWFHILDNKSTQSESEWASYESRIHQNMDRIYRILDKNNVKATFFCLGWIAEKYPEVIKEICNRGYEIGSHTRMHQLVYSQTPNQFKADVEHSIHTLEDLTGKKVKYFRAPGFSITEKTKWAFEILVELGIEIDCSIFPAVRSHGGFPSYGTPKPSILEYKGVSIKELPINYSSLLSTTLIFSGGGYFRLLPYKIIKKWTKQSDYVMTYFHPRDFDTGQPVIKELSYSRRFKSYVGIGKAEFKLDKWLRDCDFVDVNTANKQIDWNSVVKVQL
ncbi:polysaccharide deacetylase family protein [Winogradskyella sp. R77965]|uniref:polysaccharide deacetylase family protein n=1 Tax=Winogradskyella sp. R77965 TaxID=3093872 RepID=UPI0037DC6F94